MTPEERGKSIREITGRTMVQFGSPRPIPSVDWYVSQIRAAVEERDREWVEAHSKRRGATYNPEAWVDQQLMDPEFHAGFVVESEKMAVEWEREGCAKVATHLLKKRRDGLQRRSTSEAKSSIGDGAGRGL